MSGLVGLRIHYIVLRSKLIRMVYFNHTQLYVSPFSTHHITRSNLVALIQEKDLGPYLSPTTNLSQILWSISFLSSCFSLYCHEILRFYLHFTCEFHEFLVMCELHKSLKSILRFEVNWRQFFEEKKTSLLGEYFSSSTTLKELLNNFSLIRI